MPVSHLVTKALPPISCTTPMKPSVPSSQRVGDGRVSLPDVFVLKRPLVGFEALESVLGAAFPQELALHCIVAIKYPSQKTWLCEFVPSNPLDPVNAMALLAGGSVEGEVVTRQVRWMPEARRWYAGRVLLPQAYLAVQEFNRAWDPYLQLVRHDCRTYANMLVEELTGQPDILRDLGV